MLKYEDLTDKERFLFKLTKYELHLTNKNALKCIETLRKQDKKTCSIKENNK